jgi:phosphate transport system protein
MERQFDQELAGLRQKLLEMASIVEQIIYKAIKVLQTRDVALCEGVFADDRKVDALEIEIDDLCISLLALRQPMAVDLRFIVGAIKINNDLERMGDHGVNIAQSARDLILKSPFTTLSDMTRMATLATGMMKDSLDAFVTQDSAKAKRVCERDDSVDNMKKKIVGKLGRAMADDPSHVGWAISLILISRNLERVADLSTNIAEETIFISEARVIKHRIEEREER